MPWLDIRNLPRKCPCINIVNGLYRAVAKGYQKIIASGNGVAGRLKIEVFDPQKWPIIGSKYTFERLLAGNYLRFLGTSEVCFKTVFFIS